LKLAVSGNLRYNNGIEDALRRSSIQGDDQAGVDGLIEDTIALLSRSRQPAIAGERMAFFCDDGLNESCLHKGERKRNRTHVRRQFFATAPQGKVNGANEPCNPLTWLLASSHRGELSIGRWEREELHWAGHRHRVADGSGILAARRPNSSISLSFTTG